MTFSSILFVTTYFSDYILVSVRDVPKVLQVLQDRGFAFEAYSSQFVASAEAISPGQEAHGTDNEEPIAENKLAERVVNILRKSACPVNIDEAHPMVCVGSRTTALSAEMLVSVVRVLLAPELPSMFSITISPKPIAASLFLPEPVLREYFDETLLLGAQGSDLLVPIVLDLRPLDMQTVAGSDHRRGDAKDSVSDGTAAKDQLGGAGIVCGIISQLLYGVPADEAETGDEDPLSLSTDSLKGNNGMVLSYLSTFHGGNVFVSESDVPKAIEALGEVLK